MSHPGMQFAPDFELESERRDGNIVVRVSGELDSATSGALERECRDALVEAGTGSLTLELAHVSFIDSAGMRTMILIERLARERGASLVVVSPRDEVTELLRTAGVAQRVAFRAEPQAPPSRGELLERVDLELPREPLSPAKARTEIRELMSGEASERIGSLLLLTSELMTNAVVHAHAAGETPIALRIISYSDRIRVEVDDAGDGFDPTAPPESIESGGRGLFLVASFAAAWGAGSVDTDQGPRFRVWFELDWSKQPELA